MTDLRQAAQMALDFLDNCDLEDSFNPPTVKYGLQVRDALRAALSAQQEPVAKLWLWMNFVDGRPEYWAFDNPFPVHMDCGDPQTLGESVGYALVKPSRNGRPDVAEAEVLRRIAAAPTVQPLTDEQIAPMVKAAIGQDGGVWDRFFLFARAVERAHGIGGTHG